jgi:hypothetical protein
VRVGGRGRMGRGGVRQENNECNNNYKGNIFFESPNLSETLKKKRKKEDQRRNELCYQHDFSEKQT